MFGSIFKGIGALITSGVLFKPATIVGVGVAIWLLFVFEPEEDRYLLAKTIIPYLIMAYFAVVFALFSRDSRVYDKLNLKQVLVNIVANFMLSLMASITFIGLVNFLSF